MQVNKMFKHFFIIQKFRISNFNDGKWQIIGRQAKIANWLIVGSF